MSPLFVSFHYHTYDGKSFIGDCILQNVEPVRTTEDIEALKKRIAIHEGIKPIGMALYFFRRMEP